MNPIFEIQNKTVLISPLDWGFGHTTRCITIIHHLHKNNNKVIFAGNQRQLNLIQTEFPYIKIEIIDGYDIHLSSKKNTYLQIGSQFLKINQSIKKEHKWIHNYCDFNAIDLIISDNRYGFYHPKIESIFISHQLNLTLPYFRNIVNKQLSKYINKFNKCWIPDNTKLNLSGQLSISKHLKIKTEHIGLLSRFNLEKQVIKFDYLFIISGPQPENSIFLKRIENFITNSRFNIAIVSPIESEKIISDIHYFLNPTTQELNTILNQSHCVISKSGYTTIMEMVNLNKMSILIPTKGQFEQEYLAKHIKHDNIEFVKNLSDIKL